MTEKMYSISEIREALLRVSDAEGWLLGQDEWLLVDAELDKPADRFREGEVVVDRDTNTALKIKEMDGASFAYYNFRGDNDWHFNKDCRHLLHSEQGQHVHDLVDAAVNMRRELKRVANLHAGDHKPHQCEDAVIRFDSALEAYYAKAGK